MVIIGQNSRLGSSQNPGYDLGQGPGSCPVAERAATEMISLPMYPTLTLEQADHVADVLLASL